MGINRVVNFPSDLMNGQIDELRKALGNDDVLVEVRYMNNGGFFAMASSVVEQADKGDKAFSEYCIGKMKSANFVLSEKSYIAPSKRREKRKRINRAVPVGSSDYTALKGR